MSQTLLEMAKDLVLAQIQAHSLSPEDMHTALQDTYRSLLALHAQEASRGMEAVETPETPPAPINWRKSITKHMVTCLACGARFKQLSVHHLREHGLDARSYRVKYGMPLRQPLSARTVTALRKQIVQRSRPWEKAPMYLKAQEKVEKKAKQPVVKKTRQQRKKGTSRVKK
jgi:predicted transcriptional regulator